MEALVTMVNKRYSRCPVLKVYIDDDDIWSDILSFYKCAKPPTKKRLRIRLNNSPCIDTGGVRRQVYTVAFSNFIQNSNIHLFDGPPNHLRPHYNAESRGSGIFQALGAVVGHSILQDGLGFCYLSPLCYWYVACGKEKALEYSCLDDIGDDSADVISKVFNASPLPNFCQLFCGS